jgi:hypothetical protein
MTLNERIMIAAADLRGGRGESPAAIGGAGDGGDPRAS